MDEEFELKKAPRRGSGRGGVWTSKPRQGRAWGKRWPWEKSRSKCESMTEHRTFIVDAFVMAGRLRLVALHDIYH